MTFPTVIDNTMRNTFVACETRFWREFVENMGSPYPSIHLHAGACFAKGLEVFRLAFYLHDKSKDEALTEASIAMIVAWGDWEPRFSWQDKGHPKCLDGILEALHFYLDTFDPLTDPVQPWKHDGTLGVEFNAALPIPGTKHPETGDPILYAGRFDQLVEYNGTLFIEDDKTTGQLGASWLEQWELRSQLTGYCWLAQAFGHPVAGAIVRGIAIRKTGFECAQVITMREDWKIERWLTQLKRDVQRMIEMYENHKRGIPPNLNLGESCTSYGGCMFARMCQSQDPEIWRGEYGTRVWNPLEKH